MIFLYLEGLGIGIDFICFFVNGVFLSKLVFMEDGIRRGFNSDK